MRRCAWLFYVTATAAPFLLPSPSAGQTIEGRVLLAGWGEPVGAADVRLLDADLTSLMRMETDDEGRFAFLALAPGTYYLQAVYGTTFSTVEGPIELGDDAPAAPARLTMPSPLYDRAQECRGRWRASSGVVAGVAFEATTDMPLPAARVRVEWLEDGERERYETTADGAGRFVLCPVPSGIALSVWIETMGRVGERHEEFVVEPGALARLDVPLELRRGASVRVLEARRDALRPDQAATIQGHVLDAESDAPISGAAVRLGALDHAVVTDSRGRFRFANVPPGRHAFQVSRLGYAWESEPVDVQESADLRLELRAAPEAVALEAVVVRASTVEQRMARGATQAPRVVAGADLRMAEQRTADVAEVIRRFPSLEIREGRFESSDGIEYGVCIESSRALQRYAIPEQQSPMPWCEMIAVVIDGAPTVRGGELLYMLPIREVESIEFLPPMGALRWGERAALNGALVIWTRGRGPHRDESRDRRPDGP